MQIDKPMEGGNIRVVSVDGFQIRLEKELRDTEGDWFYWMFRAKFELPGRYRFSFLNGNALGTQGPAFSTDDGRSWCWLGPNSVNREHGDAFDFEFKEGTPSTVLFCLAPQYLPWHLNDFFHRHHDSPFLTRSALSRSRKGREVTRVTVRDSSLDAVPYRLFLSSRHHACEMMATYVLEGMLEAALADDDLGKRIRAFFTITAVPFIDTDGVYDGDQGKNRRPHDHARDYGPEPVYPETSAVMQFLSAHPQNMILDLHCPWLYGQGNETVYMVGPKSKRMAKEVHTFGTILEGLAPVDAPFRTSDIIPFGVGWNTDANYTKGNTLVRWSEKHVHGLRYASTLEFPYANARETVLTPDSARHFGNAMMRAVCAYFGIPESGSPETL